MRRALCCDLVERQRRTDQDRVHSVTDLLHLEHCTASGWSYEGSPVTTHRMCAAGRDGPSAVPVRVEAPGRLRGPRAGLQRHGGRPPCQLRALDQHGRQQCALQEVTARHVGSGLPARETLKPCLASSVILHRCGRIWRYIVPACHGTARGQPAGTARVAGYQSGPFPISALRMCSASPSQKGLSAWQPQVAGASGQNIPAADLMGPEALLDISGATAAVADA